MINQNWSKEAMLVVTLVSWLVFGACYAAEDPIAVPTFHCIGLYWSPEEGGEEIACRVRYRPVNANEWWEALPLWFDGRGPEQHSQVLPNRSLGDGKPKTQHEFAHQYRGSIVNLRPGTEYEIELSLQGTDQAFSKSLSKKGHGDSIPMACGRIRARTWSEDFPIGKTIVLPETSGETLVIEQSGSPDGYVLYTVAPGKTATIDGDDQIDYCISIYASYVIARGLTLENPRSHAIRIYDGHDIVIEGCDISGWGLPSSVEGNVFGKNMEAAVYAREKDQQNPTIQRVIVQRCRIHHPRYDTNSWGEYRKEVDPDRKATRWHPGGPQGVTMYNTRGNHVFRYNEIWSDAEHYYNDIFGGGSNYSAAGFPNRDSDFYCNRLMHCWDDGIEAEGANCNVRIWGNYINHTFVKIATAATHVGPLYIWRNVIGQSRANPFGTSDEDRRGPFLKAGSGRGFGGGRTYVFHNTFLQSGPPPGMSKPMGVHIGLSEYGGPMLNHISRNNILHVLDSRGISISNKKRPELRQSSDFDYDLYNGRLQAPEGSESHGIQGEPIYDPHNGPGEFALASDSPGYDAGVVLPNFNDDFTGSAPDMGAHESGTPAMQFGVGAYLYNGNLH